MGAKKASCFYVQLIPWISSHKYVFDTAVLMIRISNIYVLTNYICIYKYLDENIHISDILYRHNTMPFDLAFFVLLIV